MAVANRPPHEKSGSRTLAGSRRRSLRANHLRIDHAVIGPAVIEQMDSSILVLPGMSFQLLSTGVLILEEND